MLFRSERTGEAFIPQTASKTPDFFIKNKFFNYIGKSLGGGSVDGKANVEKIEGNKIFVRNSELFKNNLQQKRDTCLWADYSKSYYLSFEEDDIYICISQKESSQMSYTYKYKMELNKIAARWPAKAVAQFFFL